MMRTAISPRLAMRIFFTGKNLTILALALGSGVALRAEALVRSRDCLGSCSTRELHVRPGTSVSEAAGPRREAKRRPATSERVRLARSAVYSGMLPCFFGGFLSRLCSSVASA